MGFEPHTDGASVCSVRLSPESGGLLLRRHPMMTRGKTGLDEVAVDWWILGTQNIECPRWGF